MFDNTSTAPLIVLDRVSKLYATPDGPFPALADVSLELPRGRFVAVTGKSGSGKSTLVNLVAGLDRPTSGSVTVGGTRLDTLDESRLAAWRGLHAGVVFQFFQLLPTLTIAENVMLPIDFAGRRSPAEARARALSLLADVGIREQADKLPAALSGGQQQRAAIARALANDPPLIVADEPTGNLDSRTASAVLELLQGLARAGKTVVMVTHERDVSRLVDDVVALVDGRVEAHTSTSAGRSPEPARASSREVSRA